MNYIVSLPSVVAVVLFLISGGDVMAQGAGGAGGDRFDIFEYRVEGNTVLDDLTIERAVTPFLGEQKTFQDVEGARSALESAYARAGWLTVSVVIPEQQVSEGEVAITVVEGAVGKVRVKGAEYHLGSGIRAAVRELAEGSVPNIEVVQRQIAAASRPDLRIMPVMKAGAAPGTVDVKLEVDDEVPMHGTVEFSNRQSPNSTPQRLGGSISYDNLWQAGHSLTATAQWSPQNTEEVSQAGLTYVIPRQRGAIALYGIRSRNNYATISGSPGLGVAGNSDIYGLRYVMPLRGTADYLHSLSVGVDYKDVKQAVRLAGSPDTATPIKYAPVAWAYSGTLNDDLNSTTVEVGGVFGLRGFLGNSDEAFAVKRSGASASYSVVKLGIEHRRVIQGWRLSGRADIQLASGPLVSNEQFAAGGADSVRGYLEGEKYGDDAFRFAMQLMTPFTRLVEGSADWKLAGVAFVEGARLRTRDLSPPATTYELLRGAGVGIRLKGPRGTALDVDWARAIDGATITREGDHRFHGRFSVAF